MISPRKMKQVAGALMLSSMICGVALAAKFEVPTADLPGSKDHRLLKRYEGSVVISYEQKGFDEVTFPLSKLEVVKGERDKRNNQLVEAKTKKTLEGAYTRLLYLVPPNRSALEVVRNYRDEIKSKGGKTLYECKDAECGGNSQAGSTGGGSKMGMSTYLYPFEKFTDKRWTAGYCTMDSGVADSRYLVGELGDGSSYVSVYAFTLHPAACENQLGGRTVALVQIVEAKDLQNKMVTVDAGEMGRAISSTGRIALYGITFDTGKAEVKAESETTLGEIAKLMKSNGAMKLLVVGHTDGAGGYAANVELSQRRAAAVVSALAGKHGIAKTRLVPLGVSSASPVATNKSEEGRAKNRRVELVEN